MPTPEGSNHHSHENPTFIHDPEGVIYFGVSSAIAPALRARHLLSERSRGERYLSTPSSQIQISKPLIRNHQLYNRYYDH
jgi:(2Fe-2S) ferredoxin